MSLFSWYYFPKTWSTTLPFLFASYNFCGPLFILIFEESVCSEFIWIMFFVTSNVRASNIVSNIIISTSDHFCNSCHLKFFFSFFQNLRRFVETWKNVVQVPLIFSMKDFDWFYCSVLQYLSLLNLVVANFPFIICCKVCNHTCFSIL